jgi:hypothetical protein
MAPPSRRERAEEALLDYCMGQPQIQPESCTSELR